VKIEPDLPLSEPQTTDVLLLRQAAGGDGKAFHQLVDRHADRLFRLAVSLVGHAADAEDVLQETFAGAFKGLSGFEQRASVKTWLTRILILQAARLRRDRKRRIEKSEEANPATAGESGLTGTKIDVHAAMAKLSAEHREVLLLREFEQMTYEEIAIVLDVPRGTVESRLHRARAEMKELLKAYLT
jgi:RNA polymerase sigma-70 factor (ECF subfamily)